MKRTAAGLTATLALVLAGCSSPPPSQPSGGSAGQATRLAAKLVSPTDATLTWQAADPAPAGQAVEFATEPEGQYTVLQFVGPEQGEYKHPDLMPETPFYYRVRPIYGPASDQVEVTLPAGEFTDKDQADDHEWAPPMKRDGGSVETKSVRTFAAKPTDLKATVMHANGIRFTWTDHADGEVGYLLEVKVVGGEAFRVAAVLDPDITSFGLITLPEEKKASYRVRAYYYGPASNVVHLTTGKARA